LSCAGVKPKDRLMIPARLAIALQEDGWYLRDEIVWHKPSPMPSSVRDRTTSAHEMIYLLSKSPRYFFDAEAIAEKAVSAGQIPGGNRKVDASRPDGSRDMTIPVAETRNKRSVWRVASKPFKGAHFACYPPKLIIPCVRAGASERGVCPACGSPWVRVVKKDRKATRPGTGSKVLNHTRREAGNHDPRRHVSTTETTGWKAGCSCDAGEPIPAVVCDPFAGSGTTLKVAVGEGRRAVGCELNPKYLPLIARRMASVTPDRFAGAV
jgi:DNA modification methylase